MKDLLSFFQKNALLIVISISIILFFSYINSKPVLEGFGEEYKYLEKLPENNTWTQETQDAYKLKLKETSPNMTDDMLTQSVTNIMKLASDEEAKYFAQNGNWPYDTYVIDTINSLKTTNPEYKNVDIAQLQKQAPNRYIYLLAITKETVPQVKLLNQLETTGYNITDNEILKCVNKMPSLHNTTTNNTEITPNANVITDSNAVDVSIFEKITGLKFDGSACNICDGQNVMNGTCGFSIDGQETPEAFNIYTGKSIDNSLESVPSLINPENTIKMPSGITMPSFGI
jgi:hypothetical protein